MRTLPIGTSAPLAMIAGLLFSGCFEFPSTQVMILIDAEEAPRAQIQQLDILIFGADEGQTPEQAAELTVEKPDYPVTLALVPRDDNEGRRFGVEASGLDAEYQRIAVVRARGSYLRREARTAVLRFEESCLGVLDCHPDETCSLGRCVDAQLEDEDYGTLERGGEYALPPYTVSDHYFVFNGAPYVFNPSDNDRDPHGEGVALVAGEIIRGAGVIELLPNGDFEYRTSPSHVGEVELIYTVSNPRGMRAHGMATLTVVDYDTGRIDPGLDSDNDGIPDWIEARGCTDRYNADTDGDGIPDGAEDRNRNGIVDRYETNPCKADSAGYGLCDGAFRAGIDLARLGCDDFAVVFIDAGRQYEDENDGRTWETAFGSVDEALSSLAERELTARGRQFWLKHGSYESYESGSQSAIIEADGVGLYGGFRGTETSLAERLHPLLNPSILPRPYPGFTESAISIHGARDIVVDGFAISSDGLPSFALGSAISASSVDGLSLAHLHIDGIGGEGGDLGAQITRGDLVLNDVKGLHLSDLILVAQYETIGGDEDGYIRLENVEGKLEGMLLILHDGYVDMNLSSGPKAIFLSASRSIEITRSTFLTPEPAAALKAYIYDTDLSDERLRVALTDSIVHSPAPDQMWPTPSGMMFRDERISTDLDFTLSNISFVSDAQNAGENIARLIYYVLYSPSGDGSHGKPPKTRFDLSHLSIGFGGMSELIYISDFGSDVTIETSNNVAKLARELVSTASNDDSLIRDMGFCPLLPEVDALNRRAALPAGASCSGGAALNPPLAERLNIESLTETSAFYDWRPDTGAPDPGFHARLKGPRILALGPASDPADECGWQLEAEGDCYLTLVHSAGSEFRRVPASGWIPGEYAEHALVCFGAGPPVFVRYLAEAGFCA